MGLLFFKVAKSKDKKMAFQYQRALELHWKIHRLATMAQLFKTNDIEIIKLSYFLTFCTGMQIIAFSPKSEEPFQCKNFSHYLIKIISALVFFFLDDLIDP